MTTHITNTQSGNDEAPKPLLVYDGDCGFCLYSVRYWQKLTGTSVNYQPYQAVSSNFPSLTVDDFKAAVQYIAPDGQISSAAKASFLTLSHASGGSIWIKLYRYLPGFAFFSEKGYRFISTHRNFSYAISQLCWGRDPEPPAYDVLTWVFLRLLGILFLAAFYSFAKEALALIGSQGILPLADFLTAVYSQLGAWSYWYLPMVFWFSASDVAIQLVCWSGVMVSALCIFNRWPRMCLLVMYGLYLSLVYAGQVFMTFQWDMLLLETAILAIILVRFRVLGIWLLRWLVFRYIFVSGIVKVASGDPAWWDFTALNYHFLTQPLPTPLAWYAYYLPEYILKAGTGIALFVELVLPFFIFMPRRLRFMAGFAILCMQAGIMLTGNYNFFNLTTVVLCLTLFDDAALSVMIPKRLLSFIRQEPLKTKPWQITKVGVRFFAVVTILVSLAQFNQRYIGVAPIFSAWISSRISPLQIVNTYGPFAVMTKKRFEIIIEGSNDGVHWQEYEFNYKPGDIYQKPRWNIPLQPRLDWQMWFAALGPPEASPWFSRFLMTLLQNSRPVTSLLAVNPFPDLPPVFVRALYFDYTYTTAGEFRKSGAWWDRRLTAVYYPPVTLK